MSNVNVGNFVISVDTQKLVDLLCAVKAGELITYEALSMAIGRDVLNGARGQLRAARDKVLNEHRIDFDAVPGKGLRRIPQLEASLSGVRHIGKVRRAARRAMRRLGAVQDFNALPNDARIAHNASMAMLGAIEHATNMNCHKRIEKVIANNGALPSFAETLEQFKK